LREEMDKYLRSHYANRLEQIFLYITYKCSFGCTHCLIGDRSESFYTLPEIQDILNEIKCNGGQKVTLIGGEPTEHPQLMELINLAKSMSYEVVLDTNGFFPMHFFEDESFRKIDMICFSVDGHNASIHDSVRRKGSFNRIMSYVQLAKRNNISVKFTHTVNKTNLRFVLDMISCAIGLEIDELNFHIATYNGRAKYVTDAKVVPPKDWYLAYQSIKDFVKDNGIGKTRLRIPPRYCSPVELSQYYSNHKCFGYLGDRMLILPKNEEKGDRGGPLYACGLLIGEKSTIGWNIDGHFTFNGRAEGEFSRYYSNGLPLVTDIPICPIMSKDTLNPNFLKDRALLPLCISYKPPLQSPG